MPPSPRRPTVAQSPLRARPASPTVAAAPCYSASPTSPSHRCTVGQHRPAPFHCSRGRHRHHRRSASGQSRSGKFPSYRNTRADNLQRHTDTPLQCNVDQFDTARRFHRRIRFRRIGLRLPQNTMCTGHCPHDTSVKIAHVHIDPLCSTRWDSLSSRRHTLPPCTVARRRIEH